MNQDVSKPESSQILQLYKHTVYYKVLHQTQIEGLLIQRNYLCVCEGGEYCVRAVAELSLREQPLLLNSFKELDSREGNA